MYVVGVFSQMNSGIEEGGLGGGVCVCCCGWGCVWRV